jgi:uncharacterized SAM-binding protein YcdF (DUF218 family)
MPELSKQKYSVLNIFVIFGAAVWPGGQPSRAMLRRTLAAAHASKSTPHRLFIPSGAIGKYGPAEAEVMRDILIAEGIPGKEILVDDRSTDTLSTVLNCLPILRKHPTDSLVWVCTDRYHLPRCIWLFWLMHVKTRRCPIENGRTHTKLLKWLYYYARECPAIVWDTFVILVKR